MTPRPPVPGVLSIATGGWRRAWGLPALAGLLLVACGWAVFDLAQGEAATAGCWALVAAAAAALLANELRLTAAERAQGYALRLGPAGIECLHFPAIPWRAVRTLAVGGEGAAAGAAPALVVAVERRTFAWLARQVEHSRLDRRWRLDEDRRAIALDLAGLELSPAEVLAAAQAQLARFAAQGAARPGPRELADGEPAVLATVEPARSHG